MNELLIYLAKSSVSIGLLYLCYYFLLKNESFFQFNRFFLLSGLIMASLLPLFHYNLTETFSSPALALDPYLISYQLPTFMLHEVTITESGGLWNFSWTDWLLFVYFSVVSIKLTSLLFRIFQLQYFRLKNKTINHNGLKVVLFEKEIPTFSFFNLVFIHDDKFAHHGIDSIIGHELVHIKQWHSVDLIAAELVAVFQWFNPFIYLLKRSMQDNHEFIADDLVLNSKTDYTAYRLLLIEQSTQIKTNTLVHNFSYSLLKRRLFMMNKRKNPFRKGIGIAVAVAAMGFIVFACSSPQEKDLADLNQSGQTENNATIFTSAEVMPEFPGGMDGLIDYLSANIRYPEEARKNGVTGKVFVNFVVEKDGRVTNAKLKQGIGSGCDEESIRVVSEMPNWTPGQNEGQNVRVSFDLPILFKLDGMNDETIFEVAEQMPRFPGGVEALMAYLGENIKYPEQAKKDKITGRVFVSFVVEKNGAVSGVKVMQGIGGGCDEESVRVISSMPNWEPGKDENGENVRVQYTIPIKFALE